MMIYLHLRERYQTDFNPIGNNGEALNKSREEIDDFVDISRITIWQVLVDTTRAVTQYHQVHHAVT